MSLVFGQVSDWDIVLVVGLGLRVLTLQHQPSQPKSSKAGRCSTFTGPEPSKPGPMAFLMFLSLSSFHDLKFTLELNNRPEP